MKINVLFFVSAFVCISLLSFTSRNEIRDCYIKFNPDDLVASEPERLPESAEKFRTVKTDTGEAIISRIDGYRILYNNDKGAPFINMKVELSNEKSYETDQKFLLENIKYLIAHSKDMESKELIKIHLNGFDIWGLSRTTIEEGSTLGTYVMFPGNGVTVYFYFNNLKPEYRNFSSVEEYKKQRDKFFDSYTRYVKTCENR